MDIYILCMYGNATRANLHHRHIHLEQFQVLLKSSMPVLFVQVGTTVAPLLYTRSRQTISGVYHMLRVSYSKEQHTKQSALDDSLQQLVNCVKMYQNH